jgi:uncharacterized protein
VKGRAVDWGKDATGLLAGFLLATLTTPVGVSGAVFLLPIQLSLLGVPSPQVTPTNLMYNVVSGPGGLARYLRHGRLDRGLATRLVVGSAPGVVLGAVIRVYVVADPDTFRVLAAAVLAPVGLSILARRRGRPSGATSPDTRRRLPPGSVTALAFVVGVAGGVYGIGGGSLVGPVLVGTGMAVTVVAPAALASTWVTSVVGVLAYAVLALAAPGTVAPDWSLGLACGAGGLVGGWVGASLQPHLPEHVLRSMLGVAAVALAVVYLFQAVATG